ncbi:hypothetical protein J1N35_022828 [Gossypium stocksii]|uniref:Sodium/calcium exchanger membrane region domain-containing protein n=1 Tax=Gossypium stocksii TaxID=47602 RepID=A0A9D3VIM9_9ROSI|nr:hypothetical protein J1N35_022828 [Gossypium stocksii]
MDSGKQDIALNTVLGCVVVGTICKLVHRKRIRINKPTFVRDVCFLLLVLSSLTLILIYGRINLWGSLAFSSMYNVHVILVYIIYTIRNSGATGRNSFGSDGLWDWVPVWAHFWGSCYLKTEKSSPPDKCLFSLLAEGFIMSVILCYITAQELVVLLISLGYILGISHSILGLTALAWGNSLGDLITNLTMALNGGPQGAQVALSGCYAGPIFNTLFGLGLSLVSLTWCRYPSPVKIPKDPYLLEPLGILIATLIWTLLVLPMKDLRLDGVLGGGLFLIYFTSMSLRLVIVIEPLQLHTFT